MDIKPIETIYNGYRFRSRLEARWAVFFDEAHISYEYELEGFDLGNGQRYLPDFFLPSMSVFVEVKPTREISRTDLQKMVTFGVDGDRRLMLIIGSPTREEMFLLDRRTSEGWCSFEPMEEFETHESQLTSLFESLVDYGNVQFGQSPFMSGWTIVYKTRSPYEEHLLNGALLKARQARFEHGQTPQGPRI